MVVDRLENLEKYASLNPLFAQAIEFLQSHDLNAMEVGKTELKGKDLVVNVAQTTPKAKEQAKLETHNEFIDIFYDHKKEYLSETYLLFHIYFFVSTYLYLII